MLWTRLRAMFCDPDTGDGLGQNLATDLLWRRRFRACARQEVTWRVPDDGERQNWQGDTRLERFGDGLVAVTDVDGRRWWVVERIWHGWPDPPEFALFAITANGSLWAAADFATWPAAWHREGTER